MPKLCEVCSEHLSKYKCPACLLNYCSVPCFKCHKEVSCLSVKNGDTDQTSKEETAEVMHTQDVEEGELSDTSFDDDTKDKVDTEKLQKLEESEELKGLLRNPHLHVMMSALASTEDPTKLMADAMREPIFTEFADECLKIIEPEKT